MVTGELKITINYLGFGGQAKTLMDKKKKSATSAAVQKGLAKPTSKVEDANSSNGEQKIPRLVSEIGQASFGQKVQDTFRPKCPKVETW